MKRTITIMIIFVLLFNPQSSLATTSGDADWKQKYADVIAEAVSYSDNSGVVMYWDNHDPEGLYPGNLTGFYLIDFNFDQNPELVVIGAIFGMNEELSEIRIYTATSDEAEMIAVYTDTSPTYNTLYRNISDNSLMISFINSAYHFYGDGRFGSWGTIHMTDSTTIMDESFLDATVVATYSKVDFSNSVNNPNSPPELAFNNIDVSEEEYERLHADIYLGYEEVESRYFEVWHPDSSERTIDEFLDSFVPWNLENMSDVLQPPDETDPDETEPKQELSNHTAIRKAAEIADIDSLQSNGNIYTIEDIESIEVNDVPIYSDGEIFVDEDYFETLPDGEYYMIVVFYDGEVIEKEFTVIDGLIIEYDDEEEGGYDDVATEEETNIQAEVVETQASDKIQFELWQLVTVIFIAIGTMALIIVVLVKNKKNRARLNVQRENHRTQVSEDRNICNQCGKQIREDAVFCNHCGKPIGK